MLWLPNTPSCTASNPPGQHGKKKAFAKITGYNLQLREKQKAKLFYQITEKDLRRYYANATKVHGSTNVVLLTGLERRLDNVVQAWPTRIALLGSSFPMVTSSSTAKRPTFLLCR